MAGSNNTISYNCPKCKTPNTPKGKALTIAMTCQKCNEYFCVHSNLHDTFKTNVEPTLAIGTRGIFDGKTYEVFGFSEKKEKKYKYKWREYFLFNPYHGVAFLSEYDGNWNFMKPYANHPWALKHTDADPVVNGSDFKLYSKYKAEVVFARGEFFNDTIAVTEDAEHWEHIGPPQVLIFEQSKTMMASYLGKYMPPDAVAKAFKLTKDKLPVKKAMGYTEPILGSFTPAAMFQVTLWSFIAAVLLVLTFNNMAEDKALVHQKYSRAQLTDTKMFSTESFEVKATKNLLLNVNAPVDNDWFFAEYALINEATNEEHVFTKEIEYYYGYTDGENWHEGSRTSEAFLSSVDPGKYHINIYPEFSTNNGTFEVALFYDTPYQSNFWFLALGLSIVPGFYFFIRNLKEKRRWEDSEYSPYHYE